MIRRSRSSSVFGRTPPAAPKPDELVEKFPAADNMPAVAPELDPPPPPVSARASAHQQGVLAILRDWFDAALLAFVFVMFIRMFLIELFKIPSGSMTPTLIGGQVARVDYNQDGKLDLILFREHEDPSLFLNNGEQLVAQGEIMMPEEEKFKFYQDKVVTYEYDRILVNKFAYWFHTPRRGDVVVFKVPQRIWEIDKPIYIKRCVGEPGDVLTFDQRGGLLANAQPVQSPSFFKHQAYDLLLKQFDETLLPEISYEEDAASAGYRIQRIHVPRSEIYVFGDNTLNSRDSRYWGGVPLNNVKGKAFLRYFPLPQFKFLEGAN